MNKKNLILSVVTIIALVTFSVSFAYFLMEITGTGTNQTKVTTGKLILNIDDNSVNAENLPPVDDLDYKEYAYKKEFNIVNNGTLNGCSDIYLNIINISEELKSPYLKYAVVTSTDIYTGSFDELEDNRIKIATSSFVETKTTKLHTLYIWVSYDKANVNQASMLNTSLTATLSIESKDCKNVAHTLLSKMIEADTPQSDAGIDFTKDKDGCYYDTESGLICPEGCSEDPDTAEITCEEGKGDTNGKGLYYTSDTSKTENNEVVYYYRGNVNNNYVVFAGQCFRIVRTNEDGSIKLVNRGTATESGGTYTCPTYENITAPITTAFNENDDDNAYVGYMYGTKGSSTYELTHANINDSTVKTAIDTWYENTFKDNEKGIITDTIYCNDRSLAEGEFTLFGNTLKNTEISGYGQNETYYSGMKRLLTGTPQYKCSQTNDKFTVSSTKGNGALKYPVALLTADEAMYAGSIFGTNSKNYLYLENWEWLMTASDFLGSDADELSLVWGVVNISSVNGIGDAAFPAISLSSNIQIEKGDGTINNPYVIKE